MKSSHRKPPASEKKIALSAGTPTAWLLKGEAHTHNEATCWPWVATRNAWKWDPGGHVTLNTLALTELDGLSKKPDSIKRLVRSSPSTYKIVPFEFFVLLVWQTRILPYFILKGIEGSG